MLHEEENTFRMATDVTVYAEFAEPVVGRCSIEIKERRLLFFLMKICACPYPTQIYFSNAILSDTLTGLMQGIINC